MKTIALSLVSTWLWAASGNVDPGKWSLMILKVDAAQVSKTKEALSSLKGVKEVQFDAKTEEVHIKYDKAKLGCCSAIYSTLNQNGIDYKLVSNKEYPACKKEKDAQKSSHGGCTGKSSI